MAQTQQQQHFPQSFSPPAPSPSPNPASPVNGGGGMAQQKRQFSSPLPQNQSPYASPSFGTLQLPQNQSPMMNGTNNNMNMNMNVNNMNMNGGTPAPAPAPTGTMGPPSRPAEKATDAAELTDVLASSGIDVKEEEAFLTNSYPGPGVQAQQPPRPQQQQQQQHPQQQSLQQSPANLSFTSQASTTGTTSTPPSFGDPSMGKATAQDSFYTEPSSQGQGTFKDISTREDSEAARRAQYHLQEPFLLTKLLEQKLQRRGFELGVRIPAEGLFHPVPGRPQPIEVTGPDGSSVVRTGKTILNQDGAPLVDILNLVSICCEERLRNVVDYSSSLAKSRRAHSHGSVPIEWQDVARTTPGQPASKTGSPMSTPMKRSHSSTEQQTPRSLPDKYRMLLEKDLSSEDIRARKRAKRSENAILGENGSKPDMMEGIGSGSTPSTPVGDKTPTFDKKSVSKKEARKMVDAKASEAQQHQQSVETARMATNSMLSGRVFGTKKSYSWLQRGPGAGGGGGSGGGGGGGSGTGSGFSTPSRLNTTGLNAGGNGGEKAGRTGESNANAPKRLGGWREDNEKGAGIQVRDILFMLELDGRGARHVQKAYSKDLKEERGE